MTGQRGRDLLIKIGDGGSPESFVTVAGIRTRTFSLLAGAVDATNADSPDGWRELIRGSAPKKMEVAGAGAFRDAASDARMRSAYFSGEAVRLQLEVPGFGVFTGPFAIAELSYAGAHDDVATISIRLLSAGAISFEAD
ncbi:MAG TPA: phage major tail protein, TP901-1 family [Hyphomonadaceae bacterium]|nr:phage major tail protein, TP901-1 family [Hyphomonadaceae bacterium]